MSSLQSPPCTSTYIHHLPVSATYPCQSGMIQIIKYDSPNHVLRDVGPALRRREREANIILPLLEKLAAQQSRKTEKAEGWARWVDPPHSPDTATVPNLWLVIRTHPPAGLAGSCQGNVDFVLSCTNGSMGAYPIFIWAARPVRTMAKEFVHLRMTLLVRHLYQSLPSTKRVYSVFAPTRLTRSFVMAWSSHTGGVPVDSPYYHAVCSSVTKASLRLDSPLATSAPRRYALRKAVPGDEGGLALLCYEFAATSDPFVLDQSSALREARLLISQGQAYVCDVEGAIACMVAVTRSSTNCSAITKVATHPSYLSQGWAKRLVRDVCTRLLYDEQKSSVVLYVAIGNIPAEKVYYNVGFSGLMGTPRDPETDDEWMEIGFEKTDLGHW